jgi:predicted metal-dependent hydrolase
MLGFLAKNPFKKNQWPAQLQVSHQAQTHSITLKPSSTAKRLTMRLQAKTGNVVLTAPSRAKLSDIEAFALKNAGWVSARLANLPKAIPFANGETIWLRGEPHQIIHHLELRGQISAENNEIHVYGDKIGVARRVKLFLLLQAKADLTKATYYYAEKLGVEINSITLRDTSSRWGSCSSNGNMSYSWRIIFAPPFVLNYLCAHEVAHRQEMNHSPRFWRVVESLNSDKEAAHAWLKKNGSRLHLFGK